MFPSTLAMAVGFKVRVGRIATYAMCGNDASLFPAKRAAPTSVAWLSLLLSDTRQRLSYAAVLKKQLGSFCKDFLAAGCEYMCVWGGRSYACSRYVRQNSAK
jgi:hypothetical protein